MLAHSQSWDQWMALLDRLHLFFMFNFTSPFLLGCWPFWLLMWILIYVHLKYLFMWLFGCSLKKKQTGDFIFIASSNQRLTERFWLTCAVHCKAQWLHCINGIKTWQCRGLQQSVVWNWTNLNFSKGFRKNYKHIECEWKTALGTALGLFLHV